MDNGPNLNVDLIQNTTNDWAIPPPPPPSISARPSTVPAYSKCFMLPSSMRSEPNPHEQPASPARRYICQRGYSILSSLVLGTRALGEAEESCSPKRKGAKKTNPGPSLVPVVPHHHAIVDAEEGGSHEKDVAHGVLTAPVEDMHEEAQQDDASLASPPDGPCLRDVGDGRRQSVELDEAARAAQRIHDKAHAVGKGKVESRDVADADVLEHGDGGAVACLPESLFASTARARG